MKYETTVLALVAGLANTLPTYEEPLYKIPSGIISRDVPFNLEQTTYTEWEALTHAKCPPVGVIFSRGTFDPGSVSPFEGL